MDVRVFWMQSYAEGERVRGALSEIGVDAHAALRSGSCYLAVWSDRRDLGDLVVSLSPRGIPVNLDHVPLPRRGESPVLT